jgi:WD40 repeat protein
VGTDSFTAVSGHHDGGLRCWDLRTGDRTSDWKSIHEGIVTSVRFSPVDATKVVTNGLDSTLHVVDLRTGGVVETFQNAELSTTQSWSSVTWSPNGRFVATGSNATGIVFVWNILTGVLTKVSPPPSAGEDTKVSTATTGIVSVDWCRGGPGGQQFATLDRRGKLILWA